jgi:hypothetical protein
MSKVDPTPYTSKNRGHALPKKKRNHSGWKRSQYEIIKYGIQRKAPEAALSDLLKWILEVTRHVGHNMLQKQLPPTILTCGKHVCKWKNQNQNCCSLRCYLIGCNLYWTNLRRKSKVTKKASHFVFITSVKKTAIHQVQQQTQPSHKASHLRKRIVKIFGTISHFSVALHTYCTWLQSNSHLLNLCVNTESIQPFLFVMPCYVVKMCRGFEGTRCILPQRINVNIFLTNSTASLPRRQ